MQPRTGSAWQKGWSLIKVARSPVRIRAQESGPGHSQPGRQDGGGSMKIGSTASGQVRRSPRFKLLFISLFAWLPPALVVGAIGAQPAPAQSRNVLGKLPTAATVAFVREAGSWEQEGWTGDPGKWLPWMAANHLNGIDSLQEFDPVLYRKLAQKPADLR